MESGNCKITPSTGWAANFGGIRYHGIAVSSTVWMQKIYRDRRPMAWMPRVTKLSTRRWNQRTMDRMPRPAPASSRMLTGPKFHWAMETQSVLWVSSTRTATATTQPIRVFFNLRDRGLSKILCFLAR